MVEFDPTYAQGLVPVYERTITTKENQLPYYLQSRSLMHAKTASCLPIDPTPISLRHCLSNSGSALPDMSLSRMESQ